MSRYYGFAVILFILLALLACSDSSTKPKVESVAYQVGRCDHDMIRSLESDDTCFSAEFAQDLVIDLCLTANCCPDTNRFAMITQIRNDTAFVAVTDTAQHLCHCLCDYHAHAEFYGPPLSQYLVICSYQDSVIYSETVTRTQLLPR